MKLRRLLTPIAVLSGALFGCVVVTGTTDGYQGADAGTQAAVGCKASTDCSGGQICCVAVEGVTPTSKCQAEPCALAQLCATTAECGDAAPGCALQSCTFNGLTFNLQACGALAPCSFR